MSKPEDVTQEAWDKGVSEARFYVDWLHSGNSSGSVSDHALSALADTIARTYMSAKLEAYQEAAKVAADFVDGRLYKPKFPACSYHAGEIYEAIKSLGNAG